MSNSRSATLRPELGSSVLVMLQCSRSFRVGTGAARLVRTRASDPGRGSDDSDHDLRDFPFPEGLSPDAPPTDYTNDPRAKAIASAARRLVELRKRWLNPPEWVEWVEEPVCGYFRRPVPRDERAVIALKKRTLTNLYNARPQWLADGHAQLDAAVAAAYE